MQRRSVRRAGRQRAGDPRHRHERLDVVTAAASRRRAATGAAPPAGTEEQRFTITERGSATLRGLGDDITWTFTAIPDRAPTIALTKDPEPQARGSLQLAYKIEDDYGVTGAQAKFELKHATAPAAAAAAALRRAGLPAGAAAVAHPQRRRPDHQGSDRASMGGRRRDVDAVARDEAGNEGRSAPHEFGCRSGRSSSRCRGR